MDEIKKMLVQFMEGQTEIKIDLKEVKQKLGKVEITQEVMQKEIKQSIEVLEEMTGKQK